ncbi:MAG: hydrophobic/amphiphilic exporter (mainly bacteria), family [Acidobacteriota bacterium]|nr:hydrophobic/amphiphilic exporter (mainly bacteria), family [Acidobacteriota bacterium]
MIEAALRRPVSTIVATIAFSAVGLFSLFKLPLSLLPAIERPRLVINAKAASSSRDELLHDVTVPLERRLALVPGIASIESETSDGEATITLESTWQSDPDRLRVDVARRVEGASAIPLDELTVDVLGSDAQPVIEVAVTGGSGASRSTIAQRVVVPELARIDGAGRIEVSGASPLRLVVEPRAADLAARGLTAADVEERLRTVGRPIAAGRVREGASVRPLVVLQPVRSADELRRILVRDVPLGEIADVSLREVVDETAFRMYRHPERSEGSGRAGHDSAHHTPGSLAPLGMTGVLIRVHRAPGANAVALARGVRSRVAELASRAGDTRIRIVDDRSREVARALGELALSALLGILLGTLVLRFMLGRWRPTLALSVVIPAALLSSFAVFLVANVSLDVISLAGLALATGLLVDNSIVVLESIESARARGERDAVLRGTRQIVVAVVASSVTLMVVFAPLLYLRGLARALFGEQAIAVIASVAASLVFSLALTPVLAARGAAETKPRSPGLSSYREWLERALANPRRTALLAAIVLIITIGSGALLPRELFARGASKRVVAELRFARDLDPIAARAQGEAFWRRALAALDPNDVEAMSMQQRAGGEGELDVELKSAAKTTDAVRKLHDALRVAGVSARVRVRTSAFVEGIGGDADQIEVIASATTDRDAAALATRITSAMQRAGFVLHDDDENRARTAVTLRWNEQLLATNAISRATIEHELRAATSDSDVGQSDVTGSEPSIRLLPVAPRNVSTLPVRIGDRIVPLSAVAGVTIAARAPRVRHDQSRPAQRLVFDRANASGNPERVIANVSLGRGERVRIAGHARELGDAFAQMRLAFILVLVLLYLTIAAFYESLLLPLLVMAAIPFAAGGAFAALLVTGQSLNVMSLIGLIFLGGIVVNHTIVLIDRAEQLRAAGADEEDAIRSAAAERYRPVIMTTATAILGMIPLAILGGDGAELRRAIAIAVTGGLVAATICTLIVIPLLHRALEPLRRRGRRAEIAGELAVAVAR